MTVIELWNELSCYPPQAEVHLDDKGLWAGEILVLYLEPRPPPHTYRLDLGRITEL